MDNRQPMKTSSSDNPLTLRILAVSSLHKQYLPIATSKISNYLPQPHITFCLVTQIPHTPTPHSEQFAEDLKENLSIPWGHALLKPVHVSEE